MSYLEAELIRLAKSAGRARLANGNQPSTPHMPAADQAVAVGFLDEMRAIFPVLGVDAFESPDEPIAPAAENTTRFFIESRGGTGTSEDRSNGFFVFAGATARIDETPSLQASGGNKVRRRLIESGRLRPDGDHYVLTEDTLFKTPSAAALVLTGAHVNGRTHWRDEHGVTLKDHQIVRAGGTD